MRVLNTAKARLIAIYLLSMCVVMLSGVMLLYSRTVKVVEEEVRKNAYNTALFTAYNVKYAVLLGDKEGVRDQITQVMRDPDVVYVIVADQEGEPIIKVFRGGEKLYSPDPMNTEGLNTVSKILRDKKGRKVLEITTPVVASRPRDVEGYMQKALYGFSEKESPVNDVPQPSRIGTIKLGMTFDNARKRVKNILLSGAALFLSIALGGTALALILLNRYFITPLGKMARTASRIATGNLSKRVEVKGIYEISAFAKAFNHMVEQLQNTIAKLEKVNDKLRREINEKDDFLRAVSHDLSAPLRNVVGIATLLMRRYGDSLDERAKDWLLRIMRNVNREMEMINDLLELSRIKTRRQPFSYVDLNELIDQIIDEFSFELEAKGGRVVIKDTLPTLFCEKNRIKQLFQNLIDNAIKYSKPDQPPYIEIGYREREDDHLFYVKDNGMGIKEEDKEMIFHVFRRVQSSETSKIDGKGVGLATVKRIVETYNGDIWVESEYGKGSTFFISLPKSLGGRGDELQRAGQDFNRG